ncbi:unnamed protein product, partial [Prunus brigantina]
TKVLKTRPSHSLFGLVCLLGAPFSAREGAEFLRFSLQSIRERGEELAENIHTSRKVSYCEHLFHVFVEFFGVSMLHMMGC